MIRVRLSDEQRQELRARAARRGLAPRVRERLELLRLADATGWGAPRLARTLGCHEQTTRKYLKAFLVGGFDALPDRLPPGRPRVVTDGHLAALERLLDETERTWTMPQLVSWLEREHRVRVHPDHLSRLMQRRGFRWKRTKRSLRHKQRDPSLQAAAVAELEDLKKSGPGGGP